MREGAESEAVGPRLATRLAALATSVVLLGMGAVAVIVLTGVGNGGGGEAGFNACVANDRALVLAGHGSGDGAVEQITHRSRDGVVAMVSTGRSPRTLGGAVAADGGYVMSTATPAGRDALAIEDCWDRAFQDDS
jgi:hypothetical protein